MPQKNRVANSFNNFEGDHCVDVIEQEDGQFRFQHWRREPEDLSGWILLMDSTPVTFTSEPAAIEAAQHAVVWFTPAD